MIAVAQDDRVQVIPDAQQVRKTAGLPEVGQAPVDQLASEQDAALGFLHFQHAELQFAVAGPGDAVIGDAGGHGRRGTPRFQAGGAVEGLQRNMQVARVGNLPAGGRGIAETEDRQGVRPVQLAGQRGDGDMIDRQPCGAGPEVGDDAHLSVRVRMNRPS